MKENKLAAQSRETRARILHCADRLFFTQGFSQTSVEDICAAANVTKGAFYHHFKTKNEVYHRSFIPHLDAYLAEHYRLSPAPTAHERFLRLARCTFASGKECGKELLAQSIISLLTDRDSRLYEEDRIHTRYLREAYEAAVREGVFSRETPWQTVVMLYACLMNGFLVKWASADRHDDELIDWDALLETEISLLTGERAPAQ